MKDIVEIEGRRYKYDADYDCYYREYDASEMSHWDRWSPIYAVVVLGILCWVTV